MVHALVRFRDSALHLPVPPHISQDTAPEPKHSLQRGMSPLCEAMRPARSPAHCVCGLHHRTANCMVPCVLICSNLKTEVLQYCTSPCSTQRNSQADAQQLPEIFLGLPNGIATRLKGFALTICICV